jgi:hypothetical protein
MAGMDMAGMDHAAPVAASAPAASDAAKPARSAAIERARLKPLYLRADLTGRQEVPDKKPVNDPDGSATGLIRVQGDRVTFAFSWKGIGAPTLGHLHKGAVGTNGAVAVELFGTAMPATASAAAGVTTFKDPAMADALRADPTGFYLNLHTEEFSGGAVRGQLSKPTKSVDLLNLLQGGVEKAFLTGDQEVPGAADKPVNDPDGAAVAFLRPEGTRVGYSLAWKDISAPTLGHIHRGVRGKNGDVVVPLFGTAVPSTIVAISGTATGVDAGLVKEIRDNASGFYANLHTADKSGGAVRGQLFGGSNKGQPSASAPASAPAVALGQGSVILNSGKNQAEPDGSEGVAGPGCKNLSRPNLASSLVLAGGPIKIWNGPDCTGKSAVVTADVNDLGAIGFDKQIKSIRFAD